MKPEFDKQLNLSNLPQPNKIWQLGETEVFPVSQDPVFANMVHAIAQALESAPVAPYEPVPGEISFKHNPGQFMSEFLDN